MIVLTDQVLNVRTCRCVGSDGAFTPTYDHPSARGDLVLTTDATGRQVGALRTYGQPLVRSRAHPNR